MIRVNDLFTGIGGMALGFERTRKLKIVSMCEINPKRRQVLKHHWPTMPIFEDATELDVRDLPAAEWIIGGPPCHRTSIAAAIHGYWTGETLWPAMFRIIKDRQRIRPYYAAIVEQPNRHKDWKKKVKGDLARIGYEVSEYVIPAEAVGAPHTRERVFIVAHTYGSRLALPRESRPPQIGTHARAAATGSHWDSPPPGLLRLVDGVSPRVDGLDRKTRIQAAGSSCVPQVAEVLARLILGCFVKPKPHGLS